MDSITSKAKFWRIKKKYNFDHRAFYRDRVQKVKI